MYVVLKNPQRPMAVGSDGSGAWQRVQGWQG